MAVEARRLRRRRLVCWVLLLVGLAAWTAIRIAWVEGLSDQGVFGKYLLLADSILAGDLPEQRLGDVSIGYLTVVTLGRAAGLAATGVRDLQIVGVTLAALLCGFAARRLWGDLAGIVAAATLLASRAALVNAAEVEPETLILLIETGALLALLPARSWRGELAGGLLLGLSALVRPTVLPAALLLVAWTGWRSRTRSSSRSPTRSIVVTAAGVALPLLLLRLLLAGTPGAVMPMNPGTVLYEGWNPVATGAAGEAPQIVKDVEATIDAPDALHLAYRRVASRATGTASTATVSNRFWIDRAGAFIRTEPRAAAGLLARKLRLVVANHEVWDLRTMFLKDRELARGPWLPFAVLLSVAGAGAVATRRHPATLALLLLLSGRSAVLLLFYVTSRQRNALLPALAILAGAAVAEGWSRWRQGDRRRAAAGLGLTAAAAVALSIPPHVAREDLHGWRLAFGRTRALHASDGEVSAALALAPGASPDLPSLRAAILAELAGEPPPQRVFDLAVAAVRAGDCPTAAPLLGHLETSGYRPLRGIGAVSSVAWHRAVCALRAGELENAAVHLDRARREAAGEADVLALDAVVSELRADVPRWQSALEELDLVHDPFTARLALASAYVEAGETLRGRHIAEGLQVVLPEWSAPSRLLERGSQQRQ